MPKRMINCPLCSEKMVISEMRCAKCDARVKKDIVLCPFCQLSEDDYEFLQVFLRTQGKITDIEKILNVSYPTIKGKIDSLLRTLNLSSYTEEQDPIDALSDGKISVDEAITMLRQRRKK